MTLTPRRFAVTALLAAVGAGAVTIAQTTAPVAGTAQVVTPSGLTIIEKGTIDLIAQQGDFVTCHYTGKLADGTTFDSSLPRNEPFRFQLGVDGVIKGWAEGVTGMRVGQKRQLIIPPQLGYGAAGAPPSIPGNATLTFDIEILYISRPNAPK